jgi:hypothetical protein
MSTVLSRERRGSRAKIELDDLGFVDVVEASAKSEAARAVLLLFSEIWSSMINNESDALVLPKGFP